MKDKDILKLKLGLLTVSVIFLLTGSRLLFGSWTSINWSFWLIIGLIICVGLYQTLKSLRNKNAQIIFKEFDIATTVTLVGIITLGTIMLLIFYPLISFLFFGLGLATLSVVGGLKFITFDIDNDTVDGLFDDRDTTLTKMTVNIHSDNKQIEIKTQDRADMLVLNSNKYTHSVWTRLIENFEKLSGR